MDDLQGKEILLGTYEAFILGYKLSDDKKTLVTSFADHAHSGSVRSIAAADKFMITSGDDENVKIFNLRRRTEHGSLTHADGTINAMRFYDKKHLFTASEDGRVAILKAGTWRVEKTLVKHQSGVIDIAIHPSGKLALSIGKDRKLVTWNLIKGRSAYVTNIKEIANFVKWSPSGEFYVVGFYKRVDIYSVSTANIEFSIKLNGRSNDAVFLDDATLALSGEMPQVEIYSMTTKSLITKFDAHATRVRNMALIDGSDQSNRLLVTSSNDGLVKVWSLQSEDEGGLAAKELTSVDSKCRITCMVVHQVPEVVQGQTLDDVEVEAKVKKPKKRKSNISVEIDQSLSETPKKAKKVQESPALTPKSSKNATEKSPKIVSEKSPTMTPKKSSKKIKGKKSEVENGQSFTEASPIKKNKKKQPKNKTAAN